MKKRGLSVLMAICMLLALLPGAALAEDGPALSGACGAAGNEENVRWELSLNRDGASYTLIISGRGAMADYAVSFNNYTELIIVSDNRPWSGFIDRITAVKIEEGVTYIGNRMVSGSKSVRSVSIAGSAARMGESVASFCPRLDTLVFSKDAHLEEIGLSAFWGSALREVKIPASVAVIGGGAFKNCSSLTGITFEEGSRLTSLVGGNGAFSGTGISEIELPQTLKTIGSGTFGGSRLERIVIPKSVTRFEGGVFDGCTALEQVTFETNQIEEIGEWCFHGCAALKEIRIPDSVMRIGKSAFGSCANLEAVTFGEDSRLREINGYNTFAGCDKLTALSLPETVEVIGDSAFSKLASLTGIDFAALTALSAIERNAFADCASLGDVLRFPASLKTIEGGAFNGYAGFQAVDLSQVGEDFTLGALVFWASEKLTVYLPSETLLQKILASSNQVLRAGNIRAVTNGGTFAVGAVFAADSLAEPVKRGYVFSGWYREPGLETPLGEGAPTAGAAYYAKWTPGEYAVTFDTGDEGFTATYDEAYPALPQPVKSGSTFGGWYTRPGGGGVCVEAGDRVAITENTTLYARWDAVYVPSAPVVKAGEGGAAVLSKDKKSLVITADQGYRIAQITVNGKEREIPADGVLTGLRYGDRVAVTFEKLPEEPMSAEKAFSDLEPGAWYLGGVEYAYGQGLMQGAPDGTFRPLDTADRAAVWTILYRLAEKGGDTWYAQAQEWVIAEGVSDGTRPTAPVTREQMAAMLWRLAGSPAVSEARAKLLTAYRDGAAASEWGCEALAWAMEQGILTGTGGGALEPARPVTRGEIAVMLFRMA